MTKHFGKLLFCCLQTNFCRNEKTYLTEKNEIISTLKFQVFPILGRIKVMTNLNNFQLLQNSPQIANIKRKDFDTSFTFRATNSNEVIKLIKTLNIINKAC